MGQHSSARARSGRRMWHRVAILGAVVGFGYATIGVVGLASGTTSSTPSVYTAIAPVTVLGHSLAAHSNTDIGIAGGPIVPSDATSVQLSVTALSGTTTSSMYVYPTGATQPTSANVRWQTGETVTIPVTVAVGTNGDVRLTTDGGTVTVKVAVVGYFSPTAAPGGAGYITKVLLASLSTTTAPVATLTLPAGIYEVHAKLDADFSGVSGSDWVQCTLTDPASARLDAAGAFVSVDSIEETISMVGLDTTSGGDFAVNCSAQNGASDADIVELVAIQLSSATGDVTSG